jgi:hypothetical protein
VLIRAVSYGMTSKSSAAFQPGDSRCETSLEPVASNGLSLAITSAITASSSASKTLVSAPVETVTTCS